MQHQRTVVKKKVTERVLAETAGALRRGQHPRPLRHGLRRATSPEGERFWQYGKALGFAKGSPFG